MKVNINAFRKTGIDLSHLGFNMNGEFEYYYCTPKNAEMMAKILADSCGYRLVNNDGLYSHGGFKDWFIEEFASPGFTMEIGKGENPLPKEELYDIYADIEEALLLFCLM